MYDKPHIPAGGPSGPTMTAEQDLDALKKQAEFFQNEPGRINNRIEQFKAETSK